MSKYNNRRNSNSNLGDISYIEKKINFQRGAKFDDRLNIEFIEEKGISSHSVIIEAPEKVIKFIKINNKGITIKNKQYSNKSINITVKGEISKI